MEKAFAGADLVQMPWTGCLNASCGGLGESVAVINPINGALIASTPPHTWDPCVNEVFSGNGRIICFGDMSNYPHFPLSFFDTQTSQVIGKTNQIVYGLNDTGTVYVGDEGYGLFLGSTASDQTITTLETVDNINSSIGYGLGVFSRDGTLYAQIIMTNEQRNFFYSNLGYAYW